MLEWPKMLYALGDEIVVEGRNLATRIVEDAEAEARAVEEGWRTLETILKADVAAVVKKAKAAK